MDIGKDIAYHIRRVWEKETAIFAAFVISSKAKRSREIPLPQIQRDVSTSLDMTEI
jgi:hypothetical protein